MSMWCRDSTKSPQTLMHQRSGETCNALSPFSCPHDTIGLHGMWSAAMSRIVAPISALFRQASSTARPLKDGINHPPPFFLRRKLCWQSGFGAMPKFCWLDLLLIPGFKKRSKSTPWSASKGTRKANLPPIVIRLANGHERASKTCW